MTVTYRHALWALLTIAPCPLNAQAAQTAIEVDRHTVDGERLQKTAAVNAVVDAFNRIGTHATEIRKTMSAGDADAFDAVMSDVMAALVALPGIGLKSRDNPETIKPPRARPDRLAQLAPDLAGLNALFSRLLAVYQSSSDRKLLAAAQKSVGQMARALPEILPIVAAPTRQQ